MSWNPLVSIVIAQIIALSTRNNGLEKYGRELHIEGVVGLFAVIWIEARVEHSACESAPICLEQTAIDLLQTEWVRRSVARQAHAVGNVRGNFSRQRQ
jgi:hypothetical protein